MTNRTCLWSDESFQDRETSKFKVVKITEGETGYIETGLSYRELDGAREVVTRSNVLRGLTDDDVISIRASSMAAHMQEQGDA
jgi:hypothetical protein